ncbi:hypothetical protein [Dactylosporangium sp. NBC_01737]|uniref:hypothetical protein n=1 Tax=Dactylosporangium sp. NBC_01737 TaxID=2975959 RepID=UPI003FA3D9CA
MLLAREGWSVLVAERAERIGGAVVSAEITRPGFVSDVFSTTITSGGKRNPANADFGGSHGRGRLEDFSPSLSRSC